MRRALCLIVLLACDRGHPRESSPGMPSSPAVAPTTGTTGSSPTMPEPVAAGASTGSAPSCGLPPAALRRPAAPHRLVAIGDLHGDLDAMRAVLRAAGAIDDHDHWAGGDLVVVQTGDVLDRGDGERAMLDLSTQLEAEARAAGGAWIALLGNHELMNAAGDFRYATPLGLHTFDGAPGPAAQAPAQLPAVARGRFAALGAGGAYAKQLATTWAGPASSTTPTPRRAAGSTVSAASRRPRSPPTTARCGPARTAAIRPTARSSTPRSTPCTPSAWSSATPCSTAASARRATARCGGSTSA
ncbi:MAG TPA: metallophosphoesterase [Kofleriaceae bacterium]|nr:metallophosphoesterase [Kofleriaceae bacterium]